MLVGPTPVVSWGVGFIQAEGRSLSVVYRWLCCHPLGMGCWGPSTAICSGGWRRREILPMGSILNNPPCVPFCLEGEKTWRLMARKFGKSPVGDSLALGSRIGLVRVLVKEHLLQRWLSTKGCAWWAVLWLSLSLLPSNAGACPVFCEQSKSQGWRLCVHSVTKFSLTKTGLAISVFECQVF